MDPRPKTGFFAHGIPAKTLLGDIFVSRNKDFAGGAALGPWVPQRDHTCIIHVGCPLPGTTLWYLSLNNLSQSKKEIRILQGAHHSMDSLGL